MKNIGLPMNNNLCQRQYFVNEKVLKLSKFLRIINLQDETTTYHWKETMFNLHSSHGHITRAQRYCHLTLFWSVYNWTIHPQNYIDYI